MRGNGTVYERNGKFVGQCYDKGKRRTVTGKTRKEVQQKLRKLMVEIEEGRYVDSSNMKLGSFMKDYLESYKKNSIQLSTYKNYVDTMEKHVYTDKLADMEIGKITTDVMQKFYNRKVKEEGMSSRMVRNVYVILNGGYKNARKRGLISKNPNEDVELIRKVTREFTPPTVEDVKKFLEYEKGTSIYYSLFRILILTGLRRSECLALQKKDINWETGEIMLTHALGYIRNDGIQPESKRKSIYVLKEDMKNLASKNSVFVDEETLCALRKLIQWQESNQKAHKDIYFDKILFMTSDNRFEYVDNDILFTKEDGDFISGRALLEWFHRDLQKCGIQRCRIHDLRHFFGTNVLNVTNDIMLTSKMLRHGNISTTTNIYLHANKEKKLQASKDYQAMLGI